MESPERGITGDVLEDDVQKLPLRTGDSFWRRVVELLPVVQFRHEIEEARIEDAFRPSFLRKRAEQTAKNESDSEKATVEGF